MTYNKNIDLHQQWIGYLNPTGLVFSPHALEDAQVTINLAVISEQREFAKFICDEKNDELKYRGLLNCRSLFVDILNWRDSDLDSSEQTLTNYSFVHPQFKEVVTPSFVSKINDQHTILIQTFESDVDFDKGAESEDTWNSSVHFKFERLLREKQVSTGILLSKHTLRLIYAPRGETSGFIDFPFKIMFQPSGRLIYAAFNELFSDAKVFNSPKGQSLVEILEISRKYQAKVSVELSGQVLEALYELLRGFQAANDETQGELLKEVLAKNPQEIYEGLLTVLLRMVFVMYAEDRNLLATDSIYQSSYSLAGLFERLRQDEAQNPDTMDSRYGAWAQLLSLFRLIYEGVSYDSEKGKVVLPARHGHLFDYNKYLFLENRRSIQEKYTQAPKISDAVIFKVLKNLLILDGERISYRTLDVEQIGSVYETMMGFELTIAEGETVALKPAKAHGAPIPINLEELVSVKDKSKKLTELTDVKLTDKVKKELNATNTIAEIENVLDKRIDRRATPNRLSKGAMLLCPSEARRKSGSHYTPRELTEPIVRTALRPIFERLGEKPKPEDILDLKICDPAMGSGAFLVEACRQLSEKLVESWNFHKTKIKLPPDEDELLYAKRMIAQRCLYGVDKNHMAVNLAKLSLWLVTIAKDHAFSFLDHNLKHGDSLVGLTNKQIMAFDYKDRPDLPLFSYMKEKVETALEAREEIQTAADEQNYDALKQLEGEYSEEIHALRLVGNLVIKCFFNGDKEKERDKNIQEHQLKISNYFAVGADDKLIEYCSTQLRNFNSIIVPFHWELELPEVFSRQKKGFDCFVGNPPFLGGRRTTTDLGENYRDWLNVSFEKSSSNADLSSFFFRKSFDLLNSNGGFGFISTNTIYQGDSRRTSLEVIKQKKGTIYSAVKRVQWPGEAAVVVSFIHISKLAQQEVYLDGCKVSVISPYLTSNDISGDPYVLVANSNLSFQGCIILGMGFTFDDTKGDSVAGSITNMNDIITTDNKYSNVIKPYIGGDEVNNEPKHLHHRFVIDFTGLSFEYIEKEYPLLIKIIKEKVYPERVRQTRVHLRERWWQFAETRPALYRSIKNLNRVLALSCQASVNYCITFVSPNQVFANSIAVIALDKFCDFCLLQSMIHEVWARFFGSSMKDDLRYTPSDCFETYPFPADYRNNHLLEEVGDEYFQNRAKIMIEDDEGLTQTYNRFHDPDETNSKILKLRELHQKMDQAVLDAYGWSDLKLEYDFILDYEEEDEEESSGGRKKKKPYRYKFVPELHDEILARLLKLNQERYEEEVRLGLHKKK